MGERGGGIGVRSKYRGDFNISKCITITQVKMTPSHLFHSTQSFLCLHMKEMYNI